MRSATGAGIFGEIIGAEGKILGSEEQGKIFKDKLMLDTLIGATKDKVRLTKALEEEGLEEAQIAEMESDLLVANTTINQLRKRNPLVDKILGSTVVVKELLDVILPSYDKMMVEDPANPGTQVLKYPKTPEGQAQKIQDAMTEIMRIVNIGGQAQAKGGRVGYQGGELVEDINVEETIEPGGMPGQQPIQPGGTPEIEPVGMTFEELRARLPETITDDIVILLSQSAQALEDFATIQTQQDVDNFNTKYNVNLVLPAEA
jgi:hypothetical protein